MKTTTMSFCSCLIWIYRKITLRNSSVSLILINNFRSSLITKLISNETSLCELLTQFNRAGQLKTLDISNCHLLSLFRVITTQCNLLWLDSRVNCPSTHLINNQYEGNQLSQSIALFVFGISIYYHLTRWDIPLFLSPLRNKQQTTRDEGN